MRGALQKSFDKQWLLGLHVLAEARPKAQIAQKPYMDKMVFGLKNLQTSVLRVVGTGSVE